jgi:hypothetical protein
MPKNTCFNPRDGRGLSAIYLIKLQYVFWGKSIVFLIVNPPKHVFIFKNSPKNQVIIPTGPLFSEKIPKNKETEQKNVESRIFVQNSPKASPNPFNPTKL